MPLSNTLLKYLLANPPDNIHFDKLSLKTRRAISALEAVCEYQQPSFVWAKAWPWIEALPRSLLDHPPSTPVGSKEADNFFRIVPAVYLSANEADDNTDLPTRVQVVAKTPGALSTALELWLYGSTVSQGSAQMIANVLGMVLDPGVADEALEVTTSFPEDCQVVCSISGRWDAPSICIKEIVRVVCEPTLDCRSLRSNLCLLLTISRSLYLDTMPRLISGGVVRWIAIAMSKLALPATYRLSYEDSPEKLFEHAADCARYITHYLSVCLSYDSYSILDALDEGLLLSIHRARIFMFTEHGYRSIDKNPGVRMLVLLNALTPRLVHRAILVRVVRSVKKAQKLGFYDHAPDVFLEACVRLRDEALKRHAKVTLHSMPHVCGYHQECIAIFTIPKQVDCYTLRGVLLLFNEITRRYPEELHDTSLAHGGIHWACHVVSELSSLKKRRLDTESASALEDATVCIAQCLQYLFRCISRDASAAASILEEGIILSMFRSSELLAAAAQAQPRAYPWGA
ncbi:hypothetical protein V5O48_008910 [Marasmius crinis-equi]|uniref:Uncharacterized protein n=1 Tax=Marasmius crinis-equi TaxID=585013 RepID=A0ABR3FCN1_9AGAR